MPGEVSTVGSVYGPDASPTYFDRYVLNQSAVTTTGGALGMPTNASGQSLNVVQLGAWSNHPIFGQAISWWIAIIVILVAYSYFEQHNLPTEKLGIVKIGLGNLMRVTLLAIVGITLFKMIFAKYRIDGLSDVFLGV